MIGSAQHTRRQFDYSVRILRIFPILLLLVLIHSSTQSQPVQGVRIGVLAKRGQDLALHKWSATADYLTASLPGYRFHIVPLGFSEIHNAVQEEQIDFVLANPAFYVELEKLYGVNRIATLINQNLPGQQMTIFGGVIFVRADRKDLQEISDLQTKDFMAVEPRSFGGWIMCWRELYERDIDPLRYFSSLSYGNTHDAVVLAVHDGKVDGGTVRTDTLERMAEAGTIRLEDFRILNEQKVENFPFKLSTSLYPEWPFAALKTTSAGLTRRVAFALLAMSPDDPAARDSKSAGWTAPLNYQPVHDCLLELRIGPYTDFDQFTLTDVLKRYSLQLTLIMFVLTLIVLISFYILQLNRSLRQKKQEVEDLNSTLEVKVAKRTKQIDVLLDRELYLREIMETVAKVNGLLLSATNLETLLKEACKLMTEHGHYGYSWIGVLKDNLIDEVFTANDSITFPTPPPYNPFDENDPFSLTPAAHCIRNNHSMVLEKSSTISTVSPWLDQAGVTKYRAVIALPLRANQYSPALGALSVYTRRPEGFEEEEIAMLEELAGDIGFAISSFRQKAMVARLEEERTENYEETILSFANMIDHRDTYTAGHTLRVAHYCKLIAGEMGFTEGRIRILQKAAVLHDIGKVATPDSVLLKPGTLSALDYDLIKLHATTGYDMLSNIRMYQDLARIIRHHHERYDGTGYPDHLRGADIPPLSRVMVVADAFDAMTTNRIYKPRKSIPEALRELKLLSGSQFDPEIVRSACKVLKDVKVPEAITQLPKTQMEQRRFSYFFNDKLTGLYNEDYLQIILQNNKELHEYRCLHSLHIRNLQQFNQRHGWEQGNKLMKELALELQERYPDTLLFRAYGQDFVIISRDHFDIDRAGLLFTPLKGTEVQLEMDHLDLKQDTSYFIDRLEKVKVQSEMQSLL